MRPRSMLGLMALAALAAAVPGDPVRIECRPLPPTPKDKDRPAPPPPPKRKPTTADLDALKAAEERRAKRNAKRAKAGAKEND